MSSNAEVWSRYAATAARKGRSWSRDGLRDVETIDMHGHAASRDALDYVAGAWGQVPAGPGLSPLADAVNALHHRDTFDLMVRPELRLDQLDRMGIDRQVVWPTPHLHSYYTLPYDVADEATRRANDGMAEFAAHAPSRFVPMGTLAMQHPDLAVRELDRCVSSLGIRGIQLLGHIGEREISDPLFEPFWQKAEALDVLVFVHGSGNSLGGRLKQYNLVNTIGNPLETTIALSFAISNGLLDRYPRLKILGAHGAGFLGAYSGRGDHSWGARADGHNGLDEPPSFYLRRNVWFDSVVFTPHQLRALIDTFGADHVVLGTDYPFNMGEFNPVEHILNLDGVDQEAKRAVLGETARSLLGET